jgi:hypothetical protein
MWRRTYERHWERYLQIEEVCAVEMGAVLRRLKRLEKETLREQP